MIWLSDKLVFPSYETTSHEGIIALGGDLSMERVLLAYQKGIFPWFSEGDPIVWYFPKKRMVLFPSEVKVSKSMRKVLRDTDWVVAENTAFEEVIHHCKTISRKGEFGTWITDEMEQAYLHLHHEGIAKSIEVWQIMEDSKQQKELIGGLYGIELNHVFCGESMFSKVSNASKLAFIYLARKKDYALIDCQVYNPHLASLGAKEIDQKEFLILLNKYQ